MIIFHRKVEDFFIRRWRTMLHFTLSLPKHRLKISLTRRRNLRGENGFVSRIKSILKIREGSRISRIFRYLFEQKRIKTILGGNLALLVLVCSILSPSASALSAINQTEPAALSPGAVELTTKVGVKAPLETVQITQGYSFFHPGIDFDGTTGNPVYPIMEGKVESLVFERWGLGNHIVINHGSGLKSVYAHLSKVEVQTGEEVETDKIIGKVGKSGRAFGDHLHLEVLDNDRHINPATILPLN